MNVIKTALEELYGLFVEDGSLAVAIIVWLCIVGFAFPHIAGPSAWKGPVFFVGMAIILVENVVRSARRHKSKPTT